MDNTTKTIEMPGFLGCSPTDSRPLSPRSGGGGAEGARDVRAPRGKWVGYIPSMYIYIYIYILYIIYIRNIPTYTRDYMGLHGIIWVIRVRGRCNWCNMIYIYICNYSYCDFTHQLKTGEDHDALEGSAQWFATGISSLIYQWDKPLGFSN